MPPQKGKKNYRKKRTFKRKVAKKSRQTMKKETHMLIKASGVLQPTQGATVSNYVYNMFSPQVDLTQNNELRLYSLPEHRLYLNMFDQYCVKGFKMTIKPKYNVIDASVIANTDITVGSGVYYSVIDKDGQAPSNIVQLKKYDSVRTHKINKTMNRSYFVTNSNRIWFDCQLPANDASVRSLMGYNGGITIYGESFPEKNPQFTNNSWADIEIVYYVTYRGKTLSSMSVNAETGAVTITSPDTLENVATSNCLQITEADPHAGAVPADD